MAVALLIVGILGYYFRDSFLPRPTGSATALEPPRRMELPSATNYTSFYERLDFQSLQPLVEGRVETTMGQAGAGAATQPASGDGIFRKSF